MPFQELFARHSFALAPAPPWVTEHAVPWDTPSLPDEHMVWLLADLQFNAADGDGGTVVCERYVRRLATADAVRNCSQIEIEYDPVVERLAVHHIRAWRDGQRRDCAEPARFFFRQREGGLNEQILHGRVSALLVLDDIRVGDCVDVCYSLTKTKLLPGEKIACSFPVERAQRTAAWLVTARLPLTVTPRYQAHGADVQPQESAAGGVKIWSWSGAQERALPEEPGAPPWESLPAWAQFSCYADWGEVARVIHDNWRGLFTVSDSVRALADTISGADEPPETRVLKIIRWVQEHIRYLGLEMGRGSWVPSAPDAVLARRFGDCKDKSLLLAVLLRAIGVAAGPLLVHTQWRGAVARMLPTPAAFDHAIVTFSVGGRRGFVDPADTFAGGGIFSQSLPDYGQGLSVGDNVSGLLAIPPADEAADSVSISEKFTLDSTGGVSQMFMRVTVSGGEANTLRAELARAGRRGFADHDAEALRQFFPDIRPSRLPMVTDDRDANRLTVCIAHEMTEWGAVITSDMFGSARGFNYGSRWLWRFVSRPPSTPRRAGFLPRHPLRLTHAVLVQGKLAGSGFLKERRFPADSQWFDSGTLMQWSSRWTGGKSLRMTYYYHARQAMVPAAEAADFIKAVDRLGEKLGCHVTVRCRRNFKQPPRLPARAPDADLPPADGDAEFLKNFDDDFQPDPKWLHWARMVVCWLFVLAVVALMVWLRTLR
ncbi:MAG: DUF3857 and transglutaminase domain-containing protein [Verrucomicrobiales bacterium]|jgi:transglutaminase-like putative cysteine protease|nr:DUF3857 and transglutaminase domain-containing protein [Verrucomicrobiales bacterium]